MTFAVAKVIMEAAKAKAQLNLGCDHDFHALLSRLMDAGKLLFGRIALKEM